MSISIAVNDPPRGGGTQIPLTFTPKAFNGTKAWGSNPSSWTITYVGTAAPIQTGASMLVTIKDDTNVIRHQLWGICKSDVELFGSSEGLTRRLSFVDYREYLTYDDVFCAFNMPDIRIVDGQRIKRYWHIFPADFLAQAKTFTDFPLTAAEILNEVFAADTVLTSWGSVYHAVMATTPVYKVDCMNGKKLGAVLQEVSDKLGLVFAIIGGPYRLVWTRKGESGILPGFPSGSNDRTLGTAVSGNATAVHVLGDRNAYQLMDVPLELDWARGWEDFLDFDTFADDIYQRGTDPLTGIAFKSTPGDPEQYQGRQLAYARASEIQVWEYVELRGGPFSVAGARFVDERKFHGRSRMDMPAALYIKTLLFRAFRPAIDFFSNWYGEGVPLDSIELADKVLTDVWHDPGSGEMFWDETIPLDGNGYAIVHGYRVGEDLFKTLKPEQFNASTFTNTKKVWQHIPFQLDDSGEGVRFLIFDEPVIVSDDLFVTVDGHTVVNANYTLQIPACKAALVFEAERFRETFGSGDRFETVGEGGLFREAVVSEGFFYEVLLATGQTASQAAAQVANSLNLRQWAYNSGDFKQIGFVGWELSDMIDRIDLEWSTKGRFETVHLTAEQSRNSFEPEREYDRALRTQHLLPGQEELRVQANQARAVAAAFKANPALVKSLADLISGNVGPIQPLKVVFIEGGTGTLPIGTIVRKAPTVIGPPNTNTRGVMPLAVGSSHTVLEGIVVRDAEPADGPVKVAFSGETLARVKGPVTAGDMLGLSAGPGSDDGNYLVGNSTLSPEVKAMQPVSSGETKLIRVRFGGGGGGGIHGWG